LSHLLSHIFTGFASCVSDLWYALGYFAVNRL